MAAEIDKGCSLLPVVRKIESTLDKTPPDRLVMLRFGVPEQVSDVHVGRSGVAVLPVENCTYLALANEDIGRVEVAVGERGLLVYLGESCGFVGEDPR